MAWLLPVLSTVGSLIGQNVANKSAAANNQQQQAQQQANAQQAMAMAQQILAPYLQPGATPFAGATSQLGGRPGAMQTSNFQQPTQTIGSNASPTAQGPSGSFGAGPMPGPMQSAAPQMNPTQLASMIQAIAGRSTAPALQFKGQGIM